MRAVQGGADWLDDYAAGDPDVEASHCRVQPVADDRWFGWSRPLHTFLTTGPKGWTDLFCWGRDTGVKGEMVRQLLAALEFRGEAYTIGEDHHLRWHAVTLPKRKCKARKRRARKSRAA